jgi:hypothetical protein
MQTNGDLPVARVDETSLSSLIWLDPAVFKASWRFSVTLATGAGPHCSWNCRLVMSCNDVERGEIDAAEVAAYELRRRRCRGYE